MNTVLTAFLTHNPEDLQAYYGRALPELTAIADVVSNPLGRDLSTPELIAAAKDCDVIIAHRSTPGEAAVFDASPGLLAFLRCAVDISTIDVPAASSRRRAGRPRRQELRAVDGRTCPGSDARRCPRCQRVDDRLSQRRAAAATAGSAVAGAHRRHHRLRRDRLVPGRAAARDRYARAGLRSGRRRDAATVSNRRPCTQVLAQSDFVLPLAPAAPDTDNLIDADALAVMRPGTILVNVSRGELIDEAAVAAALDSGHLGGLAMDVGRAPDQRPSPELANRPGVVATPHLGGLTPENADAQASSSVEQVRAMLAGEMPPRTVNAEHARRLRAWWSGHGDRSALPARRV